VWVASTTEAASVAALLIEFRDWYGRDWPTDASFQASVDGIIVRGDSEFLLAAPSPRAQPVAVCQLRFRHSVWTSADDCWLEDLFVRADARGAGVGAALLDFAIERARLRGCLRIELDTSEQNEAALYLYRARGFSEHSKTVAPYRELLLGLSLSDDR
jgi:GNAT superfamily N-acetyltransferase